MKIQAIFVKETKTILYSRTTHDYREDSGYAVDGGFDYCKVTFKDKDGYIPIELDGDVLLKQILYYDYAYGNKYANKYKDGYYGKFVLDGRSNEIFYKRLLGEYFEEVWKEVR